MMTERICFITPTAYGYFNPDVAETGGGAERQVHMLSTNLTKWFDVHVVVGNYGQPKTEVRDGVVLHRAHVPGSDNSLYLLPVKYLQLVAAMRRADADTYIYRGHPRMAAVTRAATRLLGKGWVYNLANDPNIKKQPESLSWPLRRLFYNGLANAEEIIAQTPHQRDRLNQRYSLEAAVVPNGYRPANEDDLVSSTDREHFLWVGRLNETQKQPHVFVNLAEDLPDYRFMIIGPSDRDEEYAGTIRERTEQLENIEYLGYIDPDAIHDYYRRAIALVNTSRFEGFPNTFLESWRCGTPVASLEINPGRFIDSCDEVGYAGGSYDRLKEILRRFGESVSIREEVGAVGRTYFENNLAIETVARRYGEALTDHPDGLSADR